MVPENASGKELGDASGTSFRLLFVCTGNTCRSPMAEAIARRELEALGWDHVQVSSAGVGAGEGYPASGGALRTAEHHGLDLSGHRSTLVTPELLDTVDLVLTMSPSHLMRVMDLGAADRSALLTSFAAGEDPDGVPDSVLDPFGGPDEEYEATYLLLEMLVERALRRLAPIVSP